jgi:2'-hydroxyisoflavone reductase
MLAPGEPDRVIELTDARDLAEWMVRCAETRAAGVMNASGPAGRTTMGDMLAECVRAAGSGARLVWVDEEFLLAQGVTPWTEMPVWIPAAENSASECDSSRARRAGLTFRPLADTVRDTLAFFTAAAADPVVSARIERGRKMPTGMAPEREAELLRAYRARR